MNRRLKCIIVDDEPMSLKLIKSYVAKLPYLILQDCFEDPVEARLYLENNEVDILYSDIQMPGMSGLELVRSLPNPPAVILISGHRDFAPEGFEIEAIDYLVKPFSFERFEKATIKAKNNIANNSTDSKKEITLNFVFIKNGQDYEKVLFDDILYFEADGDFVKIVLSNNKHIIWRYKMMELEDGLPENIFQRIHKSYIVNINNIANLLPQSIIVSNDLELPLTPTYKNNLIRKIGLK